MGAVLADVNLLVRGLVVDIELEHDLGGGMLTMKSTPSILGLVLKANWMRVRSGFVPKLSETFAFLSRLMPLTSVKAPFSTVTRPENACTCLPGVVVRSDHLPLPNQT